ncbi:MAG: hypothetical protein NC489_28665 [Ruminococcus flavefaciens]|nr:hypothetical protein [Ruminococcus flavefaciens]
MSMAKYMRDGTNRAPSSIVVSAEIFTSYIFTITANEKQFPKALRYSLIKKLQNRCCSLCEHVYDGCNKKAITEKDFKHVQKCQDKVYHDLSKLKGLIAVANSNAHLNNYEHLADLYISMTEAYSKWVRNVSRAKARAKRNGTFKHSDRKASFKKNRIKKIAREMDHDADGFAVLKRKES